MLGKRGVRRGADANGRLRDERIEVAVTIVGHGFGSARVKEKGGGDDSALRLKVTGRRVARRVSSGGRVARLE